MWWFWIVVLETILESPLDCKEIKPVNPKGNQPWVLIWRTDAEVKAPILWPPDVKSFGKDSDAGKDSEQEENNIRWLMVLSIHGHEFEQTPEYGEGQGSLVCCSPWGPKESAMA